MNRPTIEYPSAATTVLLPPPETETPVSFPFPRLPIINAESDTFTDAYLLAMCSSLEWDEKNRVAAWKRKASRKRLALLGQCSLCLVTGLYLGLVHILAFLSILETL